jgi:hypothetical protein
MCAVDDDDDDDNTFLVKICHLWLTFWHLYLLYPYVCAVHSPEDFNKVSIFFLWRCDPPWVISSRSHTTTQHSRYDSSGRVISSSQSPLPYNTKYSQETNIHAPDGIRTHDLSRRAGADLRLRTRGHWNRQGQYLGSPKCLRHQSFRSTDLLIINDWFETRRVQ